MGRPLTWRGAAAIVALGAAGPFASAQQTPAPAPQEPSAPAQPSASPPSTARIGAVHITTRDVFDPHQADENAFYTFFNWLHVPTCPEVVRRELWFAEGDTVTLDEVEELERNLRAFGIFGATDVELAPTGEPGEADLEITTRDRFSLVFGLAPSFVGGVAGISGSIGDINLFGTGKRVSASVASNDIGERTASASYTDPQLFGSWHVLSTTLGTTEEGHFFSLGVTRPFRNLQDPLSYGSSVSSVDELVDYFDSGESVAQVPRSSNGARAFFAGAYGPRDARQAVGFDVGFDDVDYAPARGRDAALIRVPGDTTSFDFGPYWTIDWADRYLKVTGIDAIDYVEDIRLGATLRVRAGGVLRDEDGVGAQLQPFAQLAGRAALQPLPETFVTLEAAGTGRWYAGEKQGYELSGAVHAYQTSLPAQTLAVSYSYATAFEAQALDPQLTLGEDNGLRGYPAREFAGTTVALLNVEDRIRTGVEVLSLRLGFAAFFDVGWVHGPMQGLSMSDPIRSVGVGLRIGSSELLGRGIARIDAAWPLDDFNGEGYGLSISFDNRQVFGFFGGTSRLRQEFQ